MRDPERIPIILGGLFRAWQLCPDLRLTQLIAAIDGTGQDTFYKEDDDWAKLIEKFIVEHK